MKNIDRLIVLALLGIDIDRMPLPQLKHGTSWPCNCKPTKPNWCEGCKHPVNSGSGNTIHVDGPDYIEHWHGRCHAEKAKQEQEQPKSGVEPC